MRKIQRIVLLFAIFVSPMGAQAFHFSLGGVQMSLFRGAMIIAIFGLLLQCIFEKTKLIIYFKENRYSVLFMLLWFAYAFISILWAKDPSNWVKNLFFIFIGVAGMLLFINCFKTQEDILSAFRALHWGILIQALIGVYEIITRDYRYFTLSQRGIRIYVAGTDRIPIAMSGNPNNFATMMLIGIFVAYICYSSASKKKLKIFYLAVLSLEIILLVMTTSRANILGLLFALMLIVLIEKRVRLFILLLIAALLLLVPSSVHFITEQLQFDFNSGNGSDYVRMNLIRNGLLFLKKTIGFGVGCGQVEAWMTSEAVYYTSGITNMHNWWIEILTGYGVWIFIGYIIFYVKLFLHNFKVIKSETDAKSRAISLSICAIMIGFVIASTSSSSNITCEYLWIFWAICITHQVAKSKTGFDSKILSENLTED